MNYENLNLFWKDRKDEILKYLYDTNGMKVTVKNEPEMEKVVSGQHNCFYCLMQITIGIIVYDYDDDL